MHWLMWPLMQWSTDPDHNPVHVQMHEQMHVHARCSCGYSFDDRFTEPCPLRRRGPRSRSRMCPRIRRICNNMRQHRGPNGTGVPRCCRWCVRYGGRVSACRTAAAPSRARS
ncbi:hypothetical protein FQ762_17635 [Streptomyces coelicolor A3(2)]|nr:hypothetical protein FQ762_17635 [Streptomyces coelicolor A3(2)]